MNAVAERPEVRLHIVDRMKRLMTAERRRLLPMMRGQASWKPLQFVLCYQDAHDLRSHVEYLHIGMQYGYQDDAPFLGVQVRRDPCAETSHAVLRDLTTKAL
jgi:hypothetical protein